MTDDQAVPPLAEAMPLGHHDLGCQCWPHYSQADLDAARAQALADAHLIPGSVLDEAIRDEREACARLADALDATVPQAIRNGEVLSRVPFADLIRARTTP